MSTVDRVNPVDSLLDDLLRHKAKGKANRASLRAARSNGSPNEGKEGNGSGSRYTPRLAELYLTAKQLPQAVLKVVSYGKCKTQFKRQMDYISRQGELVLEDQDGTLVTTVTEQRELAEDWAIDFGDNKRSRDMVHLMFSAPEAGRGDALREAAQAFLKKTFSYHPYVFVLHTDTDHPHVHCLVKMRGDDGTKLNPRKQDLTKWRKAFAELCREKGIEVEASSRPERGLSGKSQKSAISRLRARGEEAQQDKLLHEKVAAELEQKDFKPQEWHSKMSARNEVIRRRYIEAARKMAESATQLPAEKQSAAIEIAKALDSYAKKMPVELTRGDLLKERLAAGKGAGQAVECNASWNAEVAYIAIKSESVAEKNQGRLRQLDIEGDRDIEI